MRVLVTGGREHGTYEDRMWLYAGLNLIHAHQQMGPIVEIIEGGASGFDLHAKNWAHWRRACGDKITLTTVDANWTLYGPAAGPIRNAEMAKLRPDVVLACPGGDGTDNMVEVATKTGLKVIRLEKMPVVRGRYGNATAPPCATG